MLYRVKLQRAIAEQAEIVVNAESAEEAEGTARQREADGMVAWTVIDEEIDTIAELQEETESDGNRHSNG